MKQGEDFPQKEKYFGELRYREEIPAREPLLTPIPAFISRDAAAHLSRNGIHFLFKHQADALSAIYERKNVILSTGTSSGKSLCYQTPIIDALLSNSGDTALMIFPTKALAQDQRSSLVKLIPERTGDIAIYDGDTAKLPRTAIRNSARVILTNPDMLHVGILPYHTAWARFLSNLKIVVLDEVHIYRGVFGSHIANLIRRLNRVVQRYRSDPTFILCSATLSNAKTLAEKLTGKMIVEFAEDYSGNGKREISFINPPIIDQELHLRAGSIYTAAKLADNLLKKGKQLLLFCQSRRSVESTVCRLRDHGAEVNGYRSGYLPSERREIEKGLKEGDMRCVAATSALELGMDIGGMDGVISVGYPGSVSAFYQRIGRAGRNLRDASFYFIASQNPIDQYLIKHPEFIIARPFEPALIDPNNLPVVFQHLQCALFESPFAIDESFGNIGAELTRVLLQYFVDSGIARFSGSHFYWIQSDSPQRTVSLRNSGAERIAIIQPAPLTGKPTRIGEIDRSSAYWMVHEGAIYFHNGASYKIETLDLAQNIAIAIPFTAWYTTEAQKESAYFIDEIIQKKELSGSEIIVADVTVKTRVVSYQKKDNDTLQILELVPLDLPEETLKTRAFFIVLNDALRDKLRNEAVWKNDPNDYGKAWATIRENILKRDQYQCQVCRRTGDSLTLHVHHITPFRNFQNPREANLESNLTTLCADCHHRVEAAVQMRSGLSGFASAFHQIATLFLECATEDLSIISEAESANFNAQAVICLHENISGGIGLSQQIFENFEVIRAATLDLIETCECENGCPGCIGPAGEIGIGGKREAMAIGRGL